MLGKKHPDTLGSMNNLAAVLESLGKSVSLSGSASEEPSHRIGLASLPRLNYTLTI